jgi:UDPglucose 6-dehydrogenase
MLEGIYGRVCKNSPSVARMNFINAEITKLAVNTYITTKISYANMLARLCEKLPGADVNVITDALGLDTRIGSKYLKGAVSYGGPCFPRDNRALAALAAHVDASSGLAEATDVFNRAQIKSVAEIVKRNFSGAGSIGILGLTYKPNTDVTEESFGLLLAQELSAAKLPVVVFDPSPGAMKVLNGLNGIKAAKTAQECIAESGTVVLATPWAEFKEIPTAQWKGQNEARTLVDCWRALGHLDGADGVRYVRLGFGGTAAKSAGLSSSGR